MMTYSHLIILNHPHSALHAKEYLDIALVSASYDIPTAIFISKVSIQVLKTQQSIAIEQTFNMIGDFAIPLFSEESDKLHQQISIAITLTELKAKSQHIFTF
ncbi:MAG: hypothetical protein ACWIPH_04275 [Ostreibacterium sp.]